MAWNGPPDSNIPPRRGSRSGTTREGDQRLQEVTGADEHDERNRHDRRDPLQGREPSWSNYGSCVDIWAPGVGVPSNYSGGGVATFCGTSVASPHSAGGGGLYLSRHTTATPPSVESALNRP
jgi:subtilisin family serine protease